MMYDILYKLDTTGRVRTWCMETNEGNYRTHSGLLGGKIVISEWVKAQPKNVGRANATTASEQATAEVESLYKKQLAQGGYSTSMDNMGATFFEPMLAHKYDVFKKKPKWPVYCQPKLDGIRCIVNSSGMFSRAGKPIISAPHILEALKEFFEENPHLTLDGELYNHDLKDDFNKIISLVRKAKPTTEDLEESRQLAQYHVYDIIDESNPEATFEERYLRVNSYCIEPFVTNVVTRPCCNQDDLDRNYSEFLEQGYEGQMIRFNNSYENKRSKYLLKRKEFVDEEFKVLSVSEGRGNWSGYAKSIECQKKDGTIFSSGIRGNQEFAKELLTRDIKYVTVRYQNLTPDGIPRFPVAVAFWEEERDL